MIIDFKSLDSQIGFGICCLELSVSLIANGIALNLLRKKRERKVADLLITHLCGSEFLFATWELVFYSFHYQLQYTKESRLNVIGQTVLFSSIYQSVLCITIDRVLSVGLSFRYRAFVAKRKLILLLMVVWIISICMGAISFLTTRQHILIFWICFDIISAITIVSGYSYIIYTVRLQKRQFAANCPQTRLFRYQVPLCIGVTFFYLWLVPDLVLNINSDLYCVWILVLWHANIMFDPLVYALHSQRKISKDSSESSEGPT